VACAATLGEHASSKTLRQASREMANRIETARPWSQTMHAYPGLFSRTGYRHGAGGEAGGFLDRMCLRLSEYSERDYERATNHQARNMVSQVCWSFAPF
jgi:type II secretory pathway component PulF